MHRVHCLALHATITVAQLHPQTNGALQPTLHWQQSEDTISATERSLAWIYGRCRDRCTVHTTAVGKHSPAPTKGGRAGVAVEANNGSTHHGVVVAILWKTLSHGEAGKTNFLQPNTFLDSHFTMSQAAKRQKQEDVVAESIFAQDLAVRTLCSQMQALRHPFLICFIHPPFYGFWRERLITDRNSFSFRLAQGCALEDCLWGGAWPAFSCPI